MFFFFQAEDGIRDVAVTGVQTCALPISPCAPLPPTRASCAASPATPSSSWRTRQTTASRSSRSTATTSTRPRRCSSPAPLPRSSRYPNSTAAASAAAPRVRSPAISRGASGPWSLGGTDPLLPRIPEVGSSQLLTGLALTRILGGPRIPRSGEVTYALAGRAVRRREGGGRGGAVGHPAPQGRARGGADPGGLGGAGRARAAALGG